MSTYEVNYTDVENVGKKRAKAIEDVKIYLGNKKWNEVKKILTNTFRNRPTLAEIEFLMMYVGIQGYPCEAILDTLWPAKPKLKVIK